jgi:acyl-coenzyme A thioesterase PaaI-like protein
MCTSMSVAPLSTETGWHFGGVSRNLNVSYLRPVPVGITVHVVCEVANLGKNLSESQIFGR